MFPDLILLRQQALHFVESIYLLISCEQRVFLFHVFFVDANTLLTAFGLDF